MIRYVYLFRINKAKVFLDTRNNRLKYSNFESVKETKNIRNINDILLLSGVSSIISTLSKTIIFCNVMNSIKYESFLDVGSFFALLTTIWEIFFGKGILEDFMEAVFIIIIFTFIYKVTLNAFANHYKTLFYLLAYPEEFRKKFGYSVKEWYGVHLPQYKAEKEL